MWLPIKLPTGSTFQLIWGKISTTNLLVTGQPTLPPEQQLAYKSLFETAASCKQWYTKGPKKKKKNPKKESSFHCHPSSSLFTMDALQMSSFEDKKENYIYLHLQCQQPFGEGAFTSLARPGCRSYFNGRFKVSGSAAVGKAGTRKQWFRLDMKGWEAASDWTA